MCDRAALSFIQGRVQGIGVWLYVWGGAEIHIKLRVNWQRASTQDVTFASHDNFHFIIFIVFIINIELLTL